MVKEAERGGITRQELVSMIPVCILGTIDPSHYVLDMCASPGSKTIQVLEQLVAVPPQTKKQNNSTTNNNNSRSTSNRSNSNGSSGLLIANDFSSYRACVLAARCKELLAKFPSLITTKSNDSIENSNSNSNSNNSQSNSNSNSNGSTVSANPCLMITCHPAQWFPNVLIPPSSNTILLENTGVYDR